MGGFRRLARAAFGAALAGGRRVGTRSVSRTWTVDPAYVATRSRRESTLPMGARFASSSSSNDEPSTSGSGSVEVHGWGSTGEDVTDPDGSTRRDLEIAIDRTGLFRQIDDAHGGSNPATKNLVGLEKHFASIINFRGGPITVAEYMQEVLTHPEFGYYMHRDVFGEKGDFITSPEVSQVFGELMGAWAVWQWKTMGSPKECHLIELGPGRGTLMADLLRGTSVFPEFTAAVTVHLVEVSPKNRATQREKLRCSSGRDGASSCSDDARSEGAKKSIKRVRVPKNPMAGVVAGDSTENSTSHSTATDGFPAPGGKPPPYQPGAHGSTPEELGLEAVDFGFSEFGNVRYGTFPPAAFRLPVLPPTLVTVVHTSRRTRPASWTGYDQKGAFPEDCTTTVYVLPIPDTHASYRLTLSAFTIRVEWHETLDGVPGGPSIVLAHEFFDAMPVHQFTRTERGWCERLVAIRGSAGHGGKEGRTLPVASRASQSESKDDSKSNHEDQNPPRKGALEMVLSPGLTPAGALLIPKRLDGLPSEEKEGLRQLEISPRTLAIWERVAERVEKHGGAALAIDYGEEGEELSH